MSVPQTHGDGTDAGMSLAVDANPLKSAGPSLVRVASGSLDAQSVDQRLPSAASETTPIVINDPNEAMSSYLGESGYMSLFSSTYTMHASESSRQPGLQFVVSPLSRILHDTYLEVFETYLATFCPILDRDTVDNSAFSNSLLLQQALALVSSRIQPALIGGYDPGAHYDAAKYLFHQHSEPNPLVSLVAVMLFYWWSTRSPNIVSMNAVWYWTGIAIRQAQEMGLHRYSQSERRRWAGDKPSFRRRIWWTLYVSRILQGKDGVLTVWLTDTTPTRHENNLLLCPKGDRASSISKIVTSRGLQSATSQASRRIGPRSLSAGLTCARLSASWPDIFAVSKISPTREPHQRNN